MSHDSWVMSASRSRSSIHCEISLAKHRDLSLTAHNDSRLIAMHITKHRGFDDHKNMAFKFSQYCLSGCQRMRTSIHSETFECNLSIRVSMHGESSRCVARVSPPIETRPWLLIETLYAHYAGSERAVWMRYREVVIVMVQTPLRIETSLPNEASGVYL
jgi:hypothetical protein